MTTPSNLYAEKIYSEQPDVLWALDDVADYVTLISEAQRDISDGWSVSNATVTASTSSIGQPFESSALSLISGDVPSSTSETVICISEDLYDLSDLNESFGNITIGSYFYSISPYLQSVSIGFEYTNPFTLQTIQQTKQFDTSVFQLWAFVSETFEIPDLNTPFRVVLKFTYASGGSSSGDYEFYVNGISAGQWSEEFNTTSLGVSPIALPSNISNIDGDAVAADAYGMGEGVGYYLVKSNSLVAKNTGIPMVYGASGVTKLYPNENEKPSLILPGKGFLNKVGQFKEYTVEFWLKVNPSTYDSLKIFGPIASPDGLYVESGFLTLVIGKEFASHFVGEWFRPMLIDIRVTRNNATMLVNGEEVVTLPINTDTLFLPEEFVSGDSQDWLGFYAYENVFPVEIDCVAIYNYSVPIDVAKRRWVYGQGVSSPESINSAYNGTQAYIDYPFADYTSDYIYPDFANWQQGSFDNLSTTLTSIGTPSYSLPDILLEDKTLQNLYDDNYALQTSGDKFLTFRPNNSWDNKKCFLNFSRFNILGTGTAAIYGVFSSDNLATEETLIKIYNQSTGNSFSIRKDLDEIHYYLFFNGQEEEIYTTDVIVSDEKFAVGINIGMLVEHFGGNISSFFGNQNGLQVSVGGDDTGSYQFTGNIYSVGICSDFDANQILEYFDELGIVILDSYLATGTEESQIANALIAHTASYTLLPSLSYDLYFLDIGASGFWEDYLPLSYFAQFVTNDVGNTYYDLDFLQFNLGYPSPARITEYETTSSWTYNELKQSYQYPTQRTYEELDNSFITNWNDYQDMEERSEKFYKYDTGNAVIKSYISIQYISNGANSPQSNFTTVEPISETRIIDIDDFPNWISTKFEVVDNTLIYPSKSVDFNDLAIVYRLEFNNRGILKKPTTLRKLEISSQAFNDNLFNPIGTRFGVDMFPFTRAGLYFDYKADNPYSIYKGSTPYLYLNRNSGVEVRGQLDAFVSRGIAIPINSQLSTNFRVSAAQVWMRYDKEKFSETPIEIFEINHKTDTIKFYISPINAESTRAKIYSRSVATGQEVNGISYFWNGSSVREPVITSMEWGVLGISFATPLIYDLFLGAINLTGPMVFNNIAYYQENSLQQTQTTLTRPWLLVKTDGITNFDWDYWVDSYIWNQVLVLASITTPAAIPLDIYKTYIGTNKIIFDDNEGLLVDAQTIKVYNNTTWTIRVGTPV
jgi:hypothetical protein